MRCLPDVNGWVALLDEAHVFHAQALAFIQRKWLKIATCAHVENGVLRVMGHNPITDVYLLALAVAHDGCLLTLDHGVALTTVAGAAPRHLEHL